MSERRLVSIRRRVRTDAVDGYGERWSRLRDMATALGAHAWRFRSTTVDDLHLEFLEFKGSDDPRADAGVAAALDDLDRAFPASSAEEWVGG